MFENFKNVFKKKEEKISVQEPVIENKEFPFLNGCTLKANKDLPFLGLDQGDVIKLNFDGKILSVGPLSWSPEQLIEEINDGVWTLEKVSSTEVINENVENKKIA